MGKICMMADSFAYHDWARRALDKASKLRKMLGDSQ
jgi:hypothetical protein